jgi:nucleoside-diphosphate-sugar epimerase
MTAERHGTLVITGAAGFVGSHLVAHLAAEGLHDRRTDGPGALGDGSYAGGVDLEVISIDPAAVQLAPMEQEDWGE